MVSRFLETLQTTFLPSSNSANVPVPVDETSDAPFREVQLLDGGVVLGGVSLLETKRLYGILGLQRLLRWSVVVLTPKLVSDTREVSLRLHRGMLTGLELVCITEHSSNALHLRLGKLRLPTQVALPTDPAGLFIIKSARNVLGHGEHLAALLVPFVAAVGFES